MSGDFSSSQTYDLNVPSRENINTILIVTTAGEAKRTLSDTSPSDFRDQTLVARAEQTLELMHQWGYAPTVSALASDLLGGRIEQVRLADAVRASDRFSFQDEFVCLPGHEALVEKSRKRVVANRLVNGHAREVARDFTSRLVRVCPYVDCVALSGSVASGGYVPADDIDLDIFVPDGTKYLTYAAALALSLPFSLARADGRGLRKIICINVLWTRAQSMPFARKDAALAFELLHCLPLFGARYFREVISANPWVRQFFPQVATQQTTDLVTPGPTVLGRIVRWVASHPWLLGVADRLCRILSHGVYAIVHWLRRRDTIAMERLDFLRRAKYPYEVFQD